jgi:lantibiotic modifying enzyme
MRKLERWRAALLGEIVGGHWVADWAHALESPGFMLGLAGTGYSLLRQAAGNRVPSVLVLEDAIT